MTALDTTRAGPEWALIKPTISATEYMPVEIVRRGTRFTFVRGPKGTEWRVTTRGLWGGFSSEQSAYDMLEKLREDRLAFDRAINQEK